MYDCLVHARLSALYFRLEVTMIMITEKNGIVTLDMTVEEAHALANVIERVIPTAFPKEKRAEINIVEGLPDALNSIQTSVFMCANGHESNHPGICNHVMYSKNPLDKSESECAMPTKLVYPRQDNQK